MASACDLRLGPFHFRAGPSVFLRILKPVENCREIPAGAAFHPEQIRPAKGRANAALFDSTRCGRSGSFQNLILKGHAVGIVLLEPRFRGVRGGEHLDVVDVANLLAGVDVDKTIIGLSSVCASPYATNESCTAQHR